MQPANEEFYGHKGMIASASHILSKLKEKQIIKRATKELKAQDHGCGSYQNQCAIQYPIIVVGHSLGAGTAAILTILLKQTYSNVMCFAFAPPGGLLSLKAAEYSRDFVVSVVHGKDCVPRLGLHQMEKMRYDLIMAIKQCNLPKWSIITQSCCWLRSAKDSDISLQSFIEKFQMDHDYGDDDDDGGCDDDDEIPAQRTDDDCHQDINVSSSSNIKISVDRSECTPSDDHKSGSVGQKLETSTSSTRNSPRKGSKKVLTTSKKHHLSVHPNDDSISLTVHSPLYPPGSVIHLVRSHPNDG